MKHACLARARRTCAAQIHRLSAILAIVVGSASANVGLARTDTENICDHAAIRAARDQDVPVDVMRTITRVETGRSRNEAVVPWPWTVNMEGEGRWFATEDEARAYVFRHFKNGARSFDVGCFQINYKWHHQAFRSIDEMFDPEINATYAAEFLRSLFVEFGDWSKAAGAYHSRTPVYARKYAKKFDQVRARLDPAPPQGTRVRGASLADPFAPSNTSAGPPGSLVRLAPKRNAGQLSLFHTSRRGN
ncbi:tail length tape measure protein [Thalassococcus sp. S3]|nr:tail length tape measure protein [Thalassococcus sp. S3]